MRTLPLPSILPLIGIGVERVDQVEQLALECLGLLVLELLQRIVVTPCPRRLA